jgi:hypothetical protein
MLTKLQKLAFLRAFRGGGGRGWFMIGGAAWLLRMGQRQRQRHVETVYLEALRPGERLVIDHLPPPEKSRRRRR